MASHPPLAWFRRFRIPLQMLIMLTWNVRPSPHGIVHHSRFSTFGTRDGQLDKPIATQQNGAKDAASSTYARDTNGERQGTERQRAFSGLRSVQPEPTVQDKKSNGVTDIEDVRSALPNTAPTGEKPVVKAFVSTLASQTALDSGTDRAVMEQIVEKAVFRNVNGQSEMRIQLKPETLGEVRLSITSVNDKVAVQMIADRTATKDIIESQITPSESRIRPPRTPGRKN